MFPKTKLGEKKHRKHKRELEISLAIETITQLFKNDIKGENINILEFGSGNGFQISYLKQIGTVVASDIYISNDIKNMKDVTFVECNITNTPFKEGQFDIVFSNHAIEHIEDTYSAFKELKRIGKRDCIYAFSVPTNIWLMLSIPARYYGRLRAISKMLLFTSLNSNMDKPAQDDKKKNKLKRKSKSINELLHMISPIGHGVHSGFIDCYSSFRIKRWHQLFSDNGFSIIKTQPLLLYAPSEWPIIPTTKQFNRFNICSSVLFLMKKLKNDI